MSVIYDPSELEPESLPEWARASVAAALEVSPKAAPSALSHRDAAAWPLFLDAAVVSTFLPRELAPDAVAGDARAAAEQVVLGFCEMTDGPDGVEWSLTPRARAEVVEAARPTGELLQAIRRTSQRFADPVSQALQKYLREGPEPPSDLESLAGDPADLKSLEAVRSAVALLSVVTTSRVTRPQLEELDRKIGFQRLLTQFARMVEQRPEDADAGKNRYFFGRDEEIEDLRSYVGVVAADSLFNQAARVIKMVSRAFVGRGAKRVWGVGGMGKTTLISKFMLDHARVAASRFPFAYLDFDRATVSARQRAGLLAEMCLQTGTQFEELSKPLGDLRARVSHLALTLESTEDPNSISQLAPRALEFRQIVDKHLDALEKMFELRRPFLLVFDTFEVVQYTPDNVDAMEEFVQAFSYPNERGLWPRLRLIIAGRKRVTSFVGDVDELALGALDPKGSAELLMALAGDAGNPLTRSDAKKLVAAVAKATKEKNGGVQPLRLQLIGEVFKDNDTQTDGPSIAASLVHEMQQPLKSGGIAAQVFIDGILIRRVLGHVSDRRVQALADPGLVVRRITVGVIQAVMTRGTSPPDAGEVLDADAEPTVPWTVDETEARSIFEAFAKEVSLVEPDRSASINETVDGRALRHRPDVRQQMLPLIRAARPKRFEALNRLAFDYFRKCAEAEETDLESAAEAVYHGLWLKVPLSELNRLWRSSPLFDPRIELNEFDTHSLASIFLRAKTRAVLSPAEVSKLPREMALEWLDARSADLLESRRIEGSIQAVQAAAGDNYEHLDGHSETAAVLARLMYRAGLWDDARRLMWRHLEHASRKDLAGPKQQSDHETKAVSRPAAILSLLRTWATIVAKGNGPAQALEWTASVCPSVRDPLTRVEIASHLVVGIAQRRGQLRDTSEQMKSLFAESFGAVETAQWTNHQRILRLAVAAGCRPLELLEIWIEASVRVPRDVGVPVLIELLLDVFQDLPAAVKVKKSARSKVKGEVLNSLDELWLQEKATIVEVLRARPHLRARFWVLVTSDHSDWIRPLGNALTRALKGEQGDKIAQMLDSRLFLTDRIAQRRQRNGMAIVQTAADDGRLLEFARAMGTFTLLSGSDWKNERPTYPQGIFDIGNSLSRWSSTIEVASHEAPPPAPAPVTHLDDPQKNRWGDRFEKAGRRLRVIVDTEATTRTLLWFNLIVDSVDGSQLEGPVIFHLHDTFAKGVIWIRKIRDDNTALLEEVNAEETFTVGVQVKDRCGQWIGLELDLEQDPSIQSRFKPKPNRRNNKR